jgi:hypothetical protein
MDSGFGLDREISLDKSDGIEKIGGNKNTTPREMKKINTLWHVRGTVHHREIEAGALHETANFEILWFTGYREGKGEIWFIL